MTEHILKTLTPYWEAIESGDKNFEVRRDDRGFQKGDMLLLRRIEKVGGSFSVKGSAAGFGEKWRGTEFYDLRRRITYVLTGGQLGIEPGYVVLGLSNETAPNVA